MFWAACREKGGYDTLVLRPDLGTNFQLGAVPYFKGALTSITKFKIFNDANRAHVKVVTTPTLTSYNSETALSWFLFILHTCVYYTHRWMLEMNISQMREVTHNTIGWFDSEWPRGPSYARKKVIIWSCRGKKEPIAHIQPLAIECDLHVVCTLKSATLLDSLNFNP